MSLTELLSERVREMNLSHYIDRLSGNASVFEGLTRVEMETQAVDISPLRGYGYIKL